MLMPCRAQAKQLQPLQAAPHPRGLSIAVPSIFSPDPSAFQISKIVTFSITLRVLFPSQEV